MRSSRPDGLRHRELHKYYSPPPSLGRASAEDDPSAGPPSVVSPDIALTAFAQLVAWRLDARRATISLMSRGTQYVIAEGTKSLDLTHNDLHDEGDGLWLGQTSLPIDYGIGVSSLNLPPSTEPGKYACFTVPDLASDDRFRTRDYVAGPPYLKFYGGTPLTTQRGINIGCLCILDDRVRPDLTEPQREFLGVMARNIMNHLEMCREAQLQRRSLRMNKALASFVQGKAHLHPDSPNDGDSEHALSSAQTRPGLGWQDRPDDAQIGLSRADFAGAPPPLTPLPARDGGGGRGDAQDAAAPTDAAVMPSAGMPVRSAPRPSSPPAQARSRQFQRPTESRPPNTYTTASRFLREALEVDGLVFFDTSVGFYPEVEPSEAGEAVPKDSTSRDETESEANGEPSLPQGIPPPDSPVSAVSGRTFTSARYRKVIRQASADLKTAEVLGISTAETPGSDRPLSNHSGLSETVGMSEGFLQLLLKRHPKGKLWALDEDEPLSTSDEDASDGEARRAKRGREDGEAQRLLLCFPGAKSILFAPVCDSSGSGWMAGCFAWSRRDSPVMTNGVDLAYLRAFMNSVGAEISRITKLADDRQSTSFISSISHELRSPLHGILGAVNFLSDTSLDTFQRGLVDSIYSCGSTLHETLTSVLSYAKVNSLRPEESQPTSSGATQAAQGTGNGEPDGLGGTYSSANLAILCEEIVEMVEGAHFYSNDRRRGSEEEPLPSNAVGSGGQHDEAAQDDGCALTVALDVDYHPNWNFVTKPGALRRVMMNIIGNALKYSSRGSVKVRLQAQDAEKVQVNGESRAADKTMVTFTVTDTGKGISRDFLQTRLFAPFAQEDGISSSGVGLGLSIVKRLVGLLGGNIDVRSRIGQGTEVTASILMTRGPSNACGGPTSGAALDEALSRIRARSMKVALRGFPSVLEHSLERYLLDWFGCELVSDGSTSPDLVILNEVTSKNFFENERATRSAGQGGWPAVLLISLSSARWNQRRHADNPDRVVERIPQPFGAVKISKALTSCLKKMSALEESRRADREENAEQADGTPKSKPEKRLHPDLIDVEKAGGQRQGVAEGQSDPPGAEAVDQSLHIIPELTTRGRVALSRGNQDAQSLRDASLPTFESRQTADMQHTAHSADASLPGIRGQPTSRPTSPPSQKPSPRILLVDDNAINLKLLQAFMRKRQYVNIDSAMNGQEAVEAVERRGEGFDLIFMDITMPVMDGLAATRAIRAMEQRRQTEQEWTGTPALIVALTGLSSPRDEKEAFTSGVDLFMTKPVHFRKLGELLVEWEGGASGEVQGVPLMSLATGTDAGGRAMAEIHESRL
ncbi:MAG: hypothetical protein M1832_000716 [Thelocarpon impressellum]|nr:MAG: hypothetical protein M1832_000716 [Thelocarpon impressellum]